MLFQFNHELMIFMIKTSNGLLNHFPGNPFTPLKCNLNFIKFLLNMFGMQTILGLLNNITCIIKIIIILKVLNNLHSPITPFLRLSHKLRECSPLKHSDGKDHLVDGGDDLVPGLFGFQVFYLAFLIRINKINYFLHLPKGKVEFL